MAGTNEPTIATPITIAITAAITVGSAGDTPNNMPSRRRVTINASVTPVVQPIAITLTPFTKNCRTIVVPSAPSAR